VSDSRHRRKPPRATVRDWLRQPEPKLGPALSLDLELAPWLAEIVERFPRELVRGLIHSDCRVLNV
jgi:hypothetical protein